MTSASRARTFASAFDPRRNSLNAIRLILAGLVIVSHVWPLGGYGEDPGQGPHTSNLGAWAVAGFFGISGYLITASRLNSRSVMDYFWRRVLRIYPGYIVAIILVAFVVSPLGPIVDSRNGWSFEAAFHFMVQALPLHLDDYAPVGSLVTTPIPNAWLGTLWTLAHEFACYIVIGMLASAIKKQKVLLWVVLAWFVVSTAATFVLQAADTYDGSLLNRFLRLGAFFAAGSLIYLLRDRLPFAWWLALISLALIVVTILLGYFTVFGGLPTAYLMLYLGAVLPLQRVGASNDISYGMYIWSWPAEQLLVLVAGARVLPLPVFLILAVVLTVPLAWASWLLVERPALKWKRLTARVRPDREGHIPPGPPAVVSPGSESGS